MLALVAVIVVAGMIFFFSAQDGQESSKLSARVTAFFARLLMPDFDLLTPEARNALIERWGLVIRKLAHFSEYALLSVTLVIYLKCAGIIRTRLTLALAAWVASALYACTDEIHQAFVSDRGPAILDVGIDAAGALTGALLALLLVWLRTRRRATDDGSGRCA